MRVALDARVAAGQNRPGAGRKSYIYVTFLLRPRDIDEMNVYEIKERALGSRRSVFDYGQLSVLAEVPREQARVYASRLVKKGLAQKVVDGTVTFSGDPFVVATQLVEPSYASMMSAHFMRQAVSQVPAEVQCVTPLKSASVREPRIRYHRLTPALFFGFERLDRGGSYVFAASKEKAVQDSVYYWGDAPRKELDRKALRSMAGAYGRWGGPRGKRVVSWVESHDWQR